MNRILELCKKGIVDAAINMELDLDMNALDMEEMVERGAKVEGVQPPALSATMFELLRSASGQYLTKLLPDNWDAMEEDAQDEFIADYRWEPFEFYPVDEVWSQISQAADVMKRHLERFGVEIL